MCRALDGCAVRLCAPWPACGPSRPAPLRPSSNSGPALIWTPLEALAFYMSYSYAFLPSGEQLGLATTTADLAPETARNYEIGARWDPWPALTLSAAVFRLNRDDVRVADPARPGLFIKTGQTRTDGVELEVQGRATPFWQNLRGLCLPQRLYHRAHLQRHDRDRRRDHPGGE